MAFNSTTGLGVAAQVAVDTKILDLSLSGVDTHQITASVEDVAGTPTPGTVFVLTAAANASGTTTVYTGTITGGGSNAFVDEVFLVAGFVTNAVNNGTFICTASSGTTLTLDNAAGIAETHAATATQEGSTKVYFITRNSGQATVSATGLITGVALGVAVIEASAPTFSNTIGLNPDGSPVNKVYSEINVHVKL